MRFPKGKKPSSVSAIAQEPEPVVEQEELCSELSDKEGDEFDNKAITKRLLNLTATKKKNCSSCQTEMPANALRCFNCHADQQVDLLDVTDPVTVIKNNKQYKVHQIAIRDTEDENAPVFMRYIITIKDKSIISFVSMYIKLSYKAKKKKLYTRQHAVARARDLIVMYPRFAAVVGSYSKEVQNFIHDEIEPMRKQMMTQINECIKLGKIPHDALWFLYESGAAVYGTDTHGFKIGAFVKSSLYNPGFYGDTFHINGSVVKCDGEKFFYAEHAFTIDNFPGMKKLKDLNVRPLDNKTFRQLSNRGKKFAKLGLEHHYKQYNGTMMRFIGSYSVNTRLNGRIMIDCKSHNRIHLSNNTYRHTPIHVNDRNVMKSLSNEEYWLAYPRLPGFSFSLKVWGEFAVDEISNIKFDKLAFTQLVLPEEKKTLIHALVEDYRKGVELTNQLENSLGEQNKHSGASFAPVDESEDIVDEFGNDRMFTDIITGKGGGCIFLLHGSPGVGKTLTAEAVCEHLHIPLYMITVGELGTTPEVLESSLQSILELAALWGCGILMDEADIFLEKRSKKDILRNAMVGIFLRLLEYHNGVLFLTTNRLSCLDEAFSSRISVALHYHELDKAARAKIWITFLEATNNRKEVMDAIDVDQLSEFQLNGRQIRSCVRLSTARARNDDTHLTMAHLLDTLQLSLEFRTQFDSEKSVRHTRRQRRTEQAVNVKLPVILS